MTSDELDPDEARRRAITDWWAGKTLRDFIANKRAELKARSQEGSSNAR